MQKSEDDYRKYARGRLTRARWPAWAIERWMLARDNYLAARDAGLSPEESATLCRSELTMLRDDMLRPGIMRRRMAVAKDLAIVGDRVVAISEIDNDGNVIGGS